MTLHDRLERAEKTGRLDLRGLKLTYLPEIPSNVTELNCSTNNLQLLPPLPPKLTRLICSSNNLVNLPTLPRTLTLLDCSKNYLTELPDLQNTSITHLICSENMITTIPQLPPSLRCFSCHTNNIATIPEMPKSLILLWAHFNTKMSPYFQSIAESDDPLQNLHNHYEQKRLFRQILKNIVTMNNALRNTMSDDVKSNISAAFTGRERSLKDQILCLKQQIMQN